MAPKAATNTASGSAPVSGSCSGSGESQIFSFEAVAALVATIMHATGTFGKAEFHLMSKLDGARGVSGFDHLFRKVKVRAKQMLKKMEDDGGEDVVTPAKRARGSGSSSGGKKGKGKGKDVKTVDGIREVDGEDDEEVEVVVVEKGTKGKGRKKVQVEVVDEEDGDEVVEVVEKGKKVNGVKKGKRTNKGEEEEVEEQAHGERVGAGIIGGGMGDVGKERGSGKRARSPSLIAEDSVLLQRALEGGDGGEEAIVPAAKRLRTEEPESVQSYGAWEDGFIDFGFLA
ncbi:hypothetical protein MBLNU230_g5757t1 [Neophaeotheca triangularis]